MPTLPLTGNPRRDGGLSAPRVDAGATDTAAVLAFLQQVTDEVARGPLNLPCFPDIVPRVRKALDDPNSTADDIVRIAGTEPRLAARLLQTANSAVFNPSGPPITNLRQAVTRLGQNLVQSVTMAFAIQQIKTDVALRPIATELGDLWEKSLAVGSICQVLARRLNVPTDKVFLAGLLHGIGQFYLLVRAATAPSDVRASPVLREFVIDWHPAIGQSVLEGWGFDPAMCEAIGQQQDHERTAHPLADLTDVLIGSVALAQALLDRNGDLTACATINAFGSLGLTHDDLVTVLKHTDHHLDSLRASLGC